MQSHPITVLNTLVFSCLQRFRCNYYNTIENFPTKGEDTIRVGIPGNVTLLRCLEVNNAQRTVADSVQYVTSFLKVELLAIGCDMTVYKI